MTDTAGNVSQFVCYTPYSEAIVDEHLSTYEHPFKFSAKELDDITGLYDHGARSRNPMSTLWYGIDPLFEMYTDMSPYAYCHANPIRFIDPTGMFDTEEEANDFIFNNEINAMVSKRDDGTFEVYDVNNNVTYFHDEKGELNVMLNAVEVEGKMPNKVGVGIENPTTLQETEKSFLDKCWDFGEKADDFVNEEIFPILSGAVLLLQPISLTNDVYTLKNGRDIYGNEASSTDKAVAVIDIVTFGYGKYISRVTKGLTTCKILKPGMTNDLVSKASTGVGALNTVKNNSKK